MARTNPSKLLEQRQANRMEVLQWARENGAVMVVVDGVKVVWPPPVLESQDVPDGEFQSNEMTLRQWREMPRPLPTVK